jgi:hypothetical protein
VFEANVIAKGDVVIDGAESSAIQMVIIERATFMSAGAGVRVFGDKAEVNIGRCKNIGRLISTEHSRAVVTATANEWAPRATIVVRGQSIISGGSLSEANIELSDLARLAELTVDAKTKVVVTSHQSAVTFRNVRFAHVGGSLVCPTASDQCRQFELCVGGVDLIHSTIFDGVGKQILVPIDVEASAEPSAFWSLDGQLDHCVGQQVVRTIGYCGCDQEPVGVNLASVGVHVTPGKHDPKDMLEFKKGLAHRQVSLLDESQSVDADDVIVIDDDDFVVFDDDDDDINAASLRVLYWVLGVSSFILLCCVIASFVASSRRSSQLEIITTQSRPDYHHVQQKQHLMEEQEDTTHLDMFNMSTVRQRSKAGVQKQN